MKTFFEVAKLGVALQSELPEEIDRARRENWNSESLRIIAFDVRDYFRKVLRFCFRIGILCILPPLLGLIWHEPSRFPSWLYISYSIFVCASAFFVVYTLWPLMGIVQLLKSMPKGAFSEFIRPVFLSLDVLFISIGSGLVLYILPKWKFTAGLPVLVVLICCWIAAPWTAYVTRNVSVFIVVRSLQFTATLLVAVLTIISPVSVQHFQWWAQRETVNRLRVVEQKEITDEWETLKWFTPEGEANIWFSGDAITGYRLFSGPGRDQQTNQELSLVEDEPRKASIIAYLTKRKSIRGEDANAVKQKQLREDFESAAKEKANLSDRLTAEYVFLDFRTSGTSQRPLVLIALNERQQEDQATTQRISDLLSSNGLPNTQSLFTPTYITSPEFRSLLGGNQAAGTTFHAEQFAKHLLVIHTIAAPSSERLTENLVAVDAKWMVRLISAASGRAEYSVEIKERGIGMREATARDNAIEKAEFALKNLVPSLKGKL